MTLTIRPIDPVKRPFFAGEVSGIDLRRTMTQGQVGEIVAGMDKYAVLVFHDQQIDDAQQLAFSRNFGTLELANADIRRDEERRLAPEIADVSNLGKNNEIMSREDRRRLFSLGNMLWHSDSSFKSTPAKYSLLHARAMPRKAATPSSPTCAPPTTRSTTTRRREIADLVCEHSQQYSRGQLGLPSSPTRSGAQPAGAAAAGPPPPGQRRPQHVPVGACRRDRRLADARGARVSPRPQRARDPAPVRLRP